MTRTVMASVSRGLLVLLLLVASAAAQEKKATGKPSGESAKPAEPGKIVANVDKDGGPVTVYFVKRAITVSGAPIDRAAIVVQDGVIKAVGPRDRVEVPANAKTVDAKGQVAVPGFVDPAGLTYSSKSRYSSAGRSTSGNKKVSSSLKPDRKTAQQLAKAGYTTVAVIPTGGGLAGLGALVRPVKGGAEPLESADVIREDGAVLAMGFDAGTASRKMWVETIDKARKYITDLAAYEKAKKEAPKAKPAEKPAKDEKKPDPKASDPKKPAKDEKKPEKKDEAKKKPEDKGPKEPKKDDKLMPLVDVLEGRQAGILGMDSASDFLHFEEMFEKEPAFRPALLLVVTSNRAQAHAWRVLDRIKALGVPVIFGPTIGTLPRATANRRVTQRIFLEAGVPVAISPGAKVTGETVRFRLLEQIRHGISEDQILRAVTLTPAEILGIQDRCGSLEAGKDADILMFDGNPFAPTTELLEVLVGGESVYTREETR